MSDPFLICHLVRGQPAFDIAEKVVCRTCGTFDGDAKDYVDPTGCDECDDGYWWIIPTSGHRAYPYQQWMLNELLWSPTSSDPKIPITDAAESIMASLELAGWPDHYAINNRALRSAPTSSLADRLGLNVRQPSAPIRRRV